MEHRTYGYIRVSTKEQNEHRQRIALKEFPVEEKTFILLNWAEKILTVRNIKSL